MTNKPPTLRHAPQLHIDTEAIGTRLRILVTSQFCGRCELSVMEAAADIARLLTEVTRISAELRNARLDAANLEAAIRAALHADSDGESDPFIYLRDELAGRGWSE